MTDDDTTESVNTRWDYTNDLISGLYLLAYIVLTGLAGHGLIDLTVVPVFWRSVIVVIALIAAVWTFGSEAFRTAMKYKA